PACSTGVCFGTMGGQNNKRSAFTSVVSNGSVGSTAPGSKSLKVSEFKLAFLGTPSDGAVAAPLVPSPSIGLQTAAGIGINDNNDTVSISLLDKTGKAITKGVKLVGSSCAKDGLSCTQTLINGVATFDNVSIDTAGTYALTAISATKFDSDNKNVLSWLPSAQFTIG